MSPAPRRRIRRAAAAVEAALWVPFLSLLLCGIADLSHFVSTQHQVARAAREGARVGAMVMNNASGGTAGEADIEAAAVSHATQVLTTAGIPCQQGCTVTAAWAKDSTTGMYLLTMNIQITYHALTGFFTSLDGKLRRSFVAMSQVQP